MNRKVFVSMLSLCVAFLLGLYVAKIFFPQEFVLAIENERIVAIGAFIDSNIILTYVCAFVTTFLTYWLFMCACKQRLSLNLRETLVVCAFIITKLAFEFIDVNISTHIGICSFFVIPLICQFDLKIATIAYSIHGLSQVLSLGIRNLPMYFTNVNSVSFMLLAIDAYLWLVLIYIIFNYRQENSYGKVDAPLLRKLKLLFQEEDKGS